MLTKCKANATAVAASLGTASAAAALPVYSPWIAAKSFVVALPQRRSFKIRKIYEDHKSHNLSEGPRENHGSRKWRSPAITYNGRQIQDSAERSWIDNEPRYNSFRRLSREETDDDEALEEDEMFYRDTTITAQEREAFATLFGSLSSYGKGKRVFEGTDEDVGMHATNTSALTSYSLLRDIDSDLQEMEDDIDENSESYEEAFDSLLNHDIGNKANFIKRYPTVLQEMASKAEEDIARELALSGKRAETSEATDMSKKAKSKEKTEQDPLIPEAQSSFSKIRKMLLEAGTDFEIWQVLESQLFEKIKSLKLDSGPASSSVPRATEGIGSGMSSQARSLRILAHVYPAALVLALRLLTRRATYSPLVFSLLPKIKELGISSYVLGASTSLYNELIAYTWQTTNSIGQVLTLLREMEREGLVMNARTARILDRIKLWGRRALEQPRSLQDQQHESELRQESAAASLEEWMRGDDGGGDSIRRGRYGSGVYAVESLHGRRAEMGEIRSWAQHVRVQLEEAAVERANARRKWQELMNDAVASPQPLSSPQDEHHSTSSSASNPLVNEASFSSY